MSSTDPQESRDPSFSWPWGLALLALLAVAGFLRFDGLAEPSLWLDEILHFEKAQVARGEPLGRWLTGLSADRENGALFYAGQVLGLSLFDGELGVRLIPAVLGVLTVGMVFLVALSVSRNPWVAWVAAAFLTVSPLHVYYSREGRPYAAVMLSAVLLLLLALERERPWARFAVYGVALATAYLGAVSAPVLIACAGLSAVLWFFDKRYAHFVVAAAGSQLLGLLLFPTAEKLGLAIGTGKKVRTLLVTDPLTAQAFDRLLASLTVSGLDRGTSNALSFVFLGLAIWGGLKLLRQDLRQAFLVVGMAVLPILGWLMILVLFDHWYNVRYTSAGLPALMVLAGVGFADLAHRWGSGLGGLLPRRRGRLPDLFSAACLGLLLFPLWSAARSEPWEKPDWRGLAETIDGLAVEGEPLLARGSWAKLCMSHYLERIDSDLEFFDTHHHLPEAQALTERYPRAWVLAAGYWRTPDYQAWMESLQPVLRSPLGNIQLYFSPDFRALFSQPDRGPGLLPLLNDLGESSHRQEFADSRFLLGAGWAGPEKTQKGRTFRWAVASRAEIALVTPPGEGPKTLNLRLMPFPRPVGEPQTIRLSIDDEPWTSVTLGPRWNKIDLPWPKAPGTVHLLSFDFGWNQRPKDLDPNATDDRPLAAAFDFVEIADAEEGVSGTAEVPNP